MDNGPTRPDGLPTTVSIPPSVLWQRVGDEVVLMDAGAGEYHGLNEVGARMWLALEESPDVAAAFATLLAIYEVEEQVLRRDLATFIEKLVAGGMLAIP